MFLNVDQTGVIKVEELYEKLLANVTELQKLEIKKDIATSKQYAMMKQWMDKFESNNPIDILLLHTFSGLMSLFITKISDIRETTGIEALNLMIESMSKLSEYMRSAK